MISDEYWALLDSAARGIGRIAIFVLVYAEIAKRLDGRPVARQLATGLVFGLAGAFSMGVPFTFAPGVAADGACVLVTLAGPFGGPYAIGLTALLTIAYRLYLNGADAMGAASGLLFVALAAHLFVRYRFRSRTVPQTQDFGFLFLASCAWIVPVLPSPGFWTLAFQHDVVIPYTILNLLGTFVLGMFLGRETRRVQAENIIRQWATTDSLTGLYNRRAFLDRLKQVSGQLESDNNKASILMLDVDGFKQINDRFGHATGDRVLSLLAQTIRASLRRGDIAGRLGGEEFGILLPREGMDGGLALAERLRLAVESQRLPELGAELRISVSIGVAEWNDQGFEEMLRHADKALYQAKNEGRNRVCAAGRTMLTAA
jgi:diguanylate cyclase (GGDEF)-like protein